MEEYPILNAVFRTLIDEITDNCFDDISFNERLEYIKQGYILDLELKEKSKNLNKKDYKQLKESFANKLGITFE